MKDNLGLSHSARKALCVQLGEGAGTEVANLIQRMAVQIEELKRSKVNITPIVPGVSASRSVESVLDSETF